MYSKLVATPKLPPPPRSPQNRSVFSCFRGADHAAVGGDEIDGGQVVARPAEPPREVAEAAAERQPGAAGGGDEPEHRGQAVELRLAVHVAEQAAGLGARHAPRRIDPDAAHQRHVEHQPAVADGQSGDVVAAALDRQRQAVLARGVDARDDVGDAETPDDQRRTPIDHRVPDRARLVELRLAGLQDRPPDLRLQFV